MDELEFPHWSFQTWSLLFVRHRMSNATQACLIPAPKAKGNGVSQGSHFFENISQSTDTARDRCREKSQSAARVFPNFHSCPPSVEAERSQCQLPAHSHLCLEWSWQQFLFPLEIGLHKRGTALSPPHPALTLHMHVQAGGGRMLEN